MSFLFFIVGGITIYSCKYDHFEDLPCSFDPDIVSFQSHILPIFRTSCNNSECHIGANPAGNLNLEDSLAYEALSNPGSGYLNTTTPTHSILYSQLFSSTLPMPPSEMLDQCSINLILKWIQQGAKNN